MTALRVGLVLAALVLLPAHAQTVPASRQQIQFSFAPVVKRAAPAVVNIFSRKVVQQRLAPMFEDPFFRQFFGNNLGMPRERVESSLGSGVILRSNGLIVTNNHVIDGASQIRVVLADRREFDATLVRADPRADLAVLRIQAAGLPSLGLADSDEIQVGDLVLAIGDPFGVGQTVTNGIISALARTTEGINDYSYFIQTDAAINPGNSGGALVNMAGQLVGINSAIYSRSGGSQGIGFAIPSNMVASFVREAESGGKLVHAWLGATLQDVTADSATALGMDHPAGALVAGVVTGSPAEEAELKAGDVILAAGGHEITDSVALRYRIATQPVGGRLTLSVLRAGAQTALTLPLRAPPEQPPREETPLAGREPFAGAVVANLNPALDEELNLDPTLRGVIILKITGGSVAENLGFQAGDRILRITGAPVESVALLVRMVSEPLARWDLAIERGGKVMTLSVGG